MVWRKVINYTDSYMAPAVVGLPLVAVGALMLMYLYYHYERRNGVPQAR